MSVRAVNAAHSLFGMAELGRGARIGGAECGALERAAATCRHSILEVNFFPRDMNSPHCPRGSRVVSVSHTEGEAVRIDSNRG